MKRYSWPPWKVWVLVSQVEGTAAVLVILTKIECYGVGWPDGGITGPTNCLFFMAIGKGNGAPIIWCRCCHVYPSSLKELAGWLYIRSQIMAPANIRSHVCIWVCLFGHLTSLSRVGWPRKGYKSGAVDENSAPFEAQMQLGFFELSSHHDALISRLTDDQNILAVRGACYGILGFYMLYSRNANPACLHRSIMCLRIPSLHCKHRVVISTWSEIHSSMVVLTCNTAMSKAASYACCLQPSTWSFWLTQRKIDSRKMYWWSQRRLSASASEWQALRNTTICISYCKQIYWKGPYHTFQTFCCL